MKLIGMLDSPFVRRVALTLAAHDVPFEHESVSVFRHMDRFGAVNPLLKAPTLVADDGTVLMDSTVILHWLEGVADLSLFSRDIPTRTLAARRTALGLVAAEKAVQVEYERKRPHQSAAWLERVVAQVDAAWEAIETELTSGVPDALSQEGVTIVCAWGYARFVTPDVAPPERFPRLAAYAATAETLPVYKRFPVDG